MPMRKSRAKTKRGKQKARNRIIREFSKGKTYKRTKRKYGKRRAIAQAVAVAYKSTG